jgi:hypothetical protein
MSDREADLASIQAGLRPWPADPMSDRRPESQIVLVLLPDNRVCVRATCAGVADAAYAPLQDSAAPSEIAKLLVELRERETGAAK